MHTIRLRGPWRYLFLSLILPDGSLVDEADQLPPAGKLSIPGNTPWDPDYRGRVQLARRFHLPTGLVPDQQVTLVVEWPGCEAEISLNGKLLGKLPSVNGLSRFSVGSLLQPRNEVLVAAEINPTSPAKMDATVSGQSKHENFMASTLPDIRLEIDG